jgi:hypothetical protein
MESTSIVSLSVRRFFFGFVAFGIIYSGIGLAIRGDHLSSSGAVIVGLGMALVHAVGWVLVGLLMQGVTRSGKGD